MTRYVSLLALACLGCGGAPQPDMTDADRSAIRSAVEQQVRVLAEGASQLSADVQISVMASDVEFIDFTNDYAGTDALREGWTNLFSRFQSFEFEWGEIDVQVLSGSWALAAARGTVRRQFVDGRFQETSPYLFMTAIFQLIDGEWKLTRGHFSGSIRTLDGAP